MSASFGDSHDLESPGTLRFHCLQVMASSSSGLILSLDSNFNTTRSHSRERASALDFKDAAAPRFGHSDEFFV